MGLTIEVLEWREETGTEIVHRFEPGGEIKFGAQLVVTENQWAVFYRDGHALDVFETGRHTLSTANIPLLVEVLKIPFGGQTPFRADAYFVSRKTFTDLRWGTRDPVVFRDPNFDMVRLRAHGRYALRVRDPKQLVNNLVGTLSSYETAAVEEYFREIIVGRLNDTLGEAGISLLELPAHYDELAAELSRRVEHDLAGYGLELEKLVVAAITPPEEVARVIDERSSMAAVGMQGQYMGFKAARALGDAAAGQGEGGSSAGQGMGLGVGAGLGMAMPGLIREALGGGGAPAAGSSTAVATAACGACGRALAADARFCQHCGAKAAAAAAACPECGAEHPPGARFCPGCGHRLEQ